jgi:site-specific recombinase XerD
MGPERNALKTLFATHPAERSADRIWRFGEFVNEVYFPFYARKWKRSTCDNNVNRVLVHLVSVFRNRNVASLRREELQDLLDEKAKSLSFSVVDHLRWDLKQVFDMAIAEGIVERNPALLLFTPKEAKKPVRRAMTLEEVRCYFAVLNLRERLIVKLAILACALGQPICYERRFGAEVGG